MVSVVRHIAKRVRHLPGIENWDGLWDTVRAPYKRFLDACGGPEITVSNCVTIRIPAEYSGGDWDNYEPETIRPAVDWARKSNRGLFLDIGSAMGIFSAAILFANPETEVIAFDSDLASLAATHRFCKYAKGNLRTIFGFVTDAGSGKTLSEAVAQSDLVLLRDNPSGDVGTTKFVCLDGSPDNGIPRNALDDLLRDAKLEARPILIKCDVEGAEQLVLQGARKLLERYHPTLLLSVHPPALPQYGHTKESVFAFLGELGYKITVLAIDHEEHWWCSH
jgi:FkbM family methyltransferase